MQTLEDDDAVIELLEDSGASGELSTTSGQELVTKRMIKEERFCNLFGLSLNEKIIKSFPCFLVSDILIQGSMVVTEKHICFYSNIPGLKRNIKIRFSDIARLTKEKVYAFFPTGIGVHTRKEKTVFSYVTSRDKLLQLLRTQWESYSEVDEDFCSSARGSSVDEAPLMDGQASSRDVSVINDEDSGILIAPNGAASTTNSVADSTVLSPTAEERAEALEASEDDYEISVGGSADRINQVFPADPTNSRPSATGWKRWSPQHAWRQLPDLEGFPNKHAISFIAVLVLICAVIIVYLSYRLNSLQQQLLSIVSTRSAGNEQSDIDHLHIRLGGIVETIGGLQEKLGNLRHLLHSMHSPDNR